MTAIHPDTPVAGRQQADRAGATAIDSGWRGLYRVGAAAALIAALIFRRNIGAEISLFRTAPTPVTALDWFALLQDNRLLGLALLNLFDLVNYALMGLIILALYFVLRRVSQSLMTLAVAAGGIGVGVYFASNQAFAMLVLSDRYAAAANDVQRALFLAAGEALLAINNPGAVYQGTGIYLSLMLVSLAGLIASLVMLQSDHFSRITAYLGILGHALVLSSFILLVFAPTLVFVPHSAAAFPLVIWELLIARRLWQLGRTHKTP